jgi:hypothetical protein
VRLEVLTYNPKLSCVCRVHNNSCKTTTSDEDEKRVTIKDGTTDKVAFLCKVCGRSGAPDQRDLEDHEFEERFTAEERAGAQDKQVPVG